MKKSDCFSSNRFFTSWANAALVSASHHGDHGHDDGVFHPHHNIPDSKCVAHMAGSTPAVVPRNTQLAVRDKLQAAVRNKHREAGRNNLAHQCSDQY